MAKSKKGFTLLLIALFGILWPLHKSKFLQNGKFSIDNGSNIIKIVGSHSNKGAANNALDALSGQAAGVNVTTNGLDRIAMLNSVRVRGTTSIMGGNDPLVIIDGVTSDVATLSTIYPADIESFTILKNASGDRPLWFTWSVWRYPGENQERHGQGIPDFVRGKCGIEAMYKHLEMLNAAEYVAAAKSMGGL